MDSQVFLRKSEADPWRKIAILQDSAEVPEEVQPTKQWFRIRMLEVFQDECQSQSDLVDFCLFVEIVVRLNLCGALDRIWQPPLHVARDQHSPDGWSEWWHSPLQRICRRGREGEQGCDIHVTSWNHCTLRDLLETNSLKIPADKSPAIFWGLHCFFGSCFFCFWARWVVVLRLLVFVWLFVVFWLLALVALLVSFYLGHAGCFCSVSTLYHHASWTDCI